MGVPRNVTVGTTPTRLCLKNAYRKGLQIQNKDSSVTVYLGGNSVSASGDLQGLAVLPTELWSWNIQDEGRKYEWYGIVASGTATVCVQEDT